MKAHYRSIGSDSVARTTPANTTQCNVDWIRADEINGSAFWTVAGGCQAIDQGVPVPTFQDDIILRGGKYTLTIANNIDVLSATNGDTLTVRVWLILCNEDGLPDDLVDAALSREWDPTLYPDFRKLLGSVKLYRTIKIAPQDSFKVEYRDRVRKIDKNDYLEQHRVFFWLWSVCNDGYAVASNYRATKSFNLSFSADVSGPGGP